MTRLPDIIRDSPRLPASLVAQALTFQTAVLSDVAGRRGTLHARIACLNTRVSCAGSALTVEVRPGDNLAIHAAMAIAKPGDVVVVDGKADQCAALMGALMMNACKKLGLAGVVVDGAVRDRLELIDLGFPVWSFGFNPAGPTKLLPGRVNHPISIGGCVVYPGDLVVADADGVVVIEREKSAAMLGLAANKVAAEQARLAAIARGDTASPWLLAALRTAGMLQADETI